MSAGIGDVEVPEPPDPPEPQAAAITSNRQASKYLISFFIVIAQPLYTLFIAPMFNQFTPLKEGELKDAIEQYVENMKFPLKEIAVMDGSKRSTHSNAYISGVGRKRIALFDTLIEKHSIKELVAVIAHEVGHYKKRHIIKGMLISIVHTGAILYLLSFFL